MWLNVLNLTMCHSGPPVKKLKQTILSFGVGNALKDAGKLLQNVYGVNCTCLLSKLKNYQIICSATIVSKVEYALSPFAGMLSETDKHRLYAFFANRNTVALRRT